MKKTLLLTLKISILIGIIMPFVLGVRDVTLITICFSSVWFIYAVLLFITTFLIKPGLKTGETRQKGMSVARYELSDTGRRDGDF